MPKSTLISKTGRMTLDKVLGLYNSCPGNSDTSADAEDLHGFQSWEAFARGVPIRLVSNEPEP